MVCTYSDLKGRRERERTKRDLLQKLGNRARTSETATDGENRSV